MVMPADAVEVELHELHALALGGHNGGSKLEASV